MHNTSISVERQTKTSYRFFFFFATFLHLRFVDNTISRSFDINVSQEIWEFFSGKIRARGILKAFMR